MSDLFRQIAGDDYVVVPRLDAADENVLLIAKLKLLIAAVAPSATRVIKSAYSVRSWPVSSFQSFATSIFISIPKH